MVEVGKGPLDNILSQPPAQAAPPGASCPEELGKEPALSGPGVSDSSPMQAFANNSHGRT